MKKIKLLICLGIILISTQGLNAQILKISEKDCVELSMDMIIKGIQKENVNTVLEVIGDNVNVQSGKALSKDNIVQKLGQIFANSSKRVKAQGKKALPKPKMGFAESNLWDFDILHPNITIREDTAIVECELVLWGAVSQDDSKVGSKVKERLVFWIPYKNQKNKTESNNPLRWKLVECNNLLDFLKDYGNKSVQNENSGGVQK